jgi:hypothetical protein
MRHSRAKQSGERLAGERHGRSGPPSAPDSQRIVDVDRAPRHFELREREGAALIGGTC